MKLLFGLLLLGTVLMPLSVYAAGFQLGYWGPILSCTGVDPQVLPPGEKVKDHCNNFCDILETGQNILKFALTLALLVIAPVMFLLGGALIATARGSTEQYSAGVKTLTGAAGGVALILVAFVIVNTFFYFVSLSPTIKGPGGNDVNSPVSTWSKINCTVKPTGQ